MYVALNFKPYKGMDFNLSYTDAKHGNEYEYKRYINGVNAIRRIISQPTLNEITWSNQTVALNFRWEMIQNGFGIINVSHSNIQGYDLTSTAIPGEVRKSAQEYLNLFTPAYLQGRNTTITFGFSFGF
jgi:hypothetical protein